MAMDRLVLQVVGRRGSGRRRAGSGAGVHLVDGWCSSVSPAPCGGAHLRVGRLRAAARLLVVLAVLFTLPGSAQAQTDNSAPTAADGEVTTDEDTAYIFAATDFNFADSDMDDTLASGSVETLPAHGALALDGTDIDPADLPQTVTKSDLDGLKLVYTPPTDTNGDDYASFTFKVHDGTDPSAASYTMTIDVDAVDDAATGKPRLDGTPQLGQPLSVFLGTIADADSLPAANAFTFKWVRVEGSTGRPRRTSTARRRSTTP